MEPVKTVTISTINDNDSRKAQVMRGMKEGLIKGVVDKAVDGMTSPIVSAIMPKVDELKLDKNLVEPAVRAALRFAVTMGLAELVDFMAPMAGKVIPNSTEDDMKRKGVLLAQWMRKYAGERVGEDLINAATAILPLIMEQFSAIKSEDLMDVLSTNMTSQSQETVNSELSI